MKSDVIKYYTEYRDKNGTIHYAIQEFSNVDRTVRMIQDHKFN